MYGHHVHEAVHRNKETVSGLTIHLVNQQYDEGRILFQKSVPLSAHMQPADIAAAILKEEHRYYASVVEDYLASRGSQTV
jgi:phosphoribosylglycinamide formyltransferase-1